MRLIPNGRGGAVDASSISRVIAGTMVSTDLDAGRAFYEGFLGLQCVRCAPDRLLIRDQLSADMARRGEPGSFVIDVTKADEVIHPQTLLNHWGLSVDSVEEVERIHDIATTEGSKYGVLKTHPITRMHGSYQFYFIDFDNNWWEIEYRIHGLTHEMLMAKGDFKKENVQETA